MDRWNQSLGSLFSYIEWRSVRKEKRCQWKSNRHSNSGMELHLILEGGCELEIGERSYSLLPGQGIIIPAGIFHICKGTKEPFLRLTLSFVPRSKGVLSLTDPALFHFPAELRRLCFDVFEEYDSTEHSYQKEMICAMILRLMISVLRCVKPQQFSSLPKESSDLRVKIDFFFSGENLVNRPTRKDLAKLLHLSERQLNRLMPELFGMTFQEKLIQVRMDYARYLLRTTQQKVSEIAYLVGYGTEAAFHKAFKTQCGTTPSVFRKTHQPKM